MSAEHANRVGVRELRQNLSVYLRRVEKGETLEVTERGRPVARLSPLPAGGSVLDRLIAEGRAAPAHGRIDDLLPIRGRPDGRASRAVRRALDEQGEDAL